MERPSDANYICPWGKVVNFFRWTNNDPFFTRVKKLDSPVAHYLDWLKTNGGVEPSDGIWCCVVVAVEVDTYNPIPFCAKRCTRITT